MKIERIDSYAIRFRFVSEMGQAMVLTDCPSIDIELL